MPLDPVSTRFLNEQVRPLADRLAGLLPLPDAFVAMFDAKGIGTLLNIPPGLLTQAAPLVDADYATVSGDILDDGRAAEGITQLTARDVLAFFRIMRFLGAMLDSDPMVQQVAFKIAVNPRL